MQAHCHDFLLMCRSQPLLLLAALLVVPVMLFPKPYILKKRHEERHNRGVRCQLSLPRHTALKPYAVVFPLRAQCLLHRPITHVISCNILITRSDSQLFSAESLYVGTTRTTLSLCVAMVGAIVAAKQLTAGIPPSLCQAARDL